MQNSATKRANPRAALGEAVPERRRRLRHWVHTPAYASLEPASNGKMLDLSTILDISEEGMSIQGSSPVEVNRKINFLLDCSETQRRIPIAGVVVWCDRSGRAGVRFEQIGDAASPETALLQLKEWLFCNILMAVAHHSAALGPRSETSGGAGQKASRKADPTDDRETDARRARDRERGFESPAAPDYTGLLAGLAAVKREVEAVGTDLDAGLCLIVGRALVFTKATGAAIAIAEMQGAPPRVGVAHEMICRASAGPDAPDLGSRLHVGSGFSGECVRLGRLLYCEDAETDARVDRASCRALGVRSLVAVPVRSGNFVAGLLEVFSPRPNAFNASQCSALQRLADTASFAMQRAAQAAARANAATLRASASGVECSSEQRVPEKSSPEKRATENDPDVPSLFGMEAEKPGIPLSRRVLLFAVALTLIGVVAWLVRTWPKDAARPPVASRHAVPLASNTPVSAPLGGIEGLRQLAQQGDASAQFALGVHYATGEDLPQDYSEAVRWFSMAAEQGQVPAQATLGAYYWAGRGVPQDMEKAYFWAILAQAGGDEASRVRVAFLASRMTRSQIVAAQQRANDWVKEHELVSNK